MDREKDPSCLHQYDVMVAGGEILKVRFLPFRDCKRLSVFTTYNHVDSGTGELVGTVLERGDVQFLNELSWYQLDDGEREPFDVVTQNYSGLSGMEDTIYSSHRFEVPKPLQDYYLDQVGDGLSQHYAEVLERGEDNRHQFHVAFLVGGESHFIDFIFRVERR